jgi:ferric-dicitrate binding protein FerR (iron transport regulator)
LEQQELYLLIIRHLSAESTVEETQFLTAWLQESEENRDTFSELKEIWATEQVSDPEVMNAGLYHVKSKIAASRTKIYIRYAAAAAVIALVAVFFSQRESYVEKSTLAGQVMHLKLPDGTLVHLAPESKIRYRNREIILEGEAFFEVTQNAHQPFSVLAGKLSVNVLGTRFNVSDTAVSLVDGKVQVKLKDNAWTLEPGQQLYYDAKEERWNQRTYDVEAVTGWASALLVFRNESFASAAAKIEKMYDVKIIFSDPETANSKLFAKFSNKSLTDVLDVIKASDNLDYTIKGKNVYISRLK